MFKNRTLADFEEVKKLTPTEGGAFSHEMKIIKKKPPVVTPAKKNNIKNFLSALLSTDATPSLPPKYQYKHYLKKQDDVKKAFSELIGQEFLRLYNPLQPKTRLIIDASGLYIHSKEVTDSVSVADVDPIGLRLNILAGNIEHFGDLLVRILILNDIDPKRDNFRLKAKKVMIKLDGDHYFAHLNSSDYTNITTEETVKDLPYIVPRARDINPLEGHYVYNWLDYVKHNMHLNTGILDKRMVNNPKIRQSINEGILTFIILPDYFISEFVTHYVELYYPLIIAQFGLSKDVIYENKMQIIQNLVTSFLTKKNEFTCAIRRNNSFKEYIGTAAAQDRITNLCNVLENFISKGKTKLVSKPLELRTQIAANAFNLNEVLNKRQSTDKSHGQEVGNIQVSSSQSKIELPNHISQNPAGNQSKRSFINSAASNEHIPPIQNTAIPPLANVPDHLLTFKKDRFEPINPSLLTRKDRINP